MAFEWDENGEPISHEIEVTPIEEHPRFAHIYAVSPWQRERAAREGGAWIDPSRLRERAQ